MGRIARENAEEIGYQETRAWVQQWIAAQMTIPASTAYYARLDDARHSFWVHHPRTDEKTLQARQWMTQYTQGLKRALSEWRVEKPTGHK